MNLQTPELDIKCQPSSVLCTRMFELTACKQGLSHPLMFLLSVPQANRNSSEMNGGVAPLLLMSRTAVLRLPRSHFCRSKMKSFCHIWMVNWENFFLLVLSHVQLSNVSAWDLKALLLKHFPFLVQPPCLQITTLVYTATSTNFPANTALNGRI